MTNELTNPKDPLDANLGKVLPGVHQWPRINNTELNKVKDEVSNIGARFDNSRDPYFQQEPIGQTYLTFLYSDCTKATRQ
jgi:hypothetical protein